MNKCRICLDHRKNLRSIYESDNGVSYVNMITSVANIKIIQTDGITNKLCLTCRKKLREVYDFKILIERSDVALNENNGSKRICFNNLNETKIKINLAETENKFTMPIDFTETFRSGEKFISYNNTVIKKLSSSNEKENQPLSVLEFLKTIKTESDNDDFDYEVDINDFGPGAKAKDNTSKQMHRNNEKKAKSKNIIFCKTPIKPVYLRDVMVVQYDPSMPRIKRKGDYTAKLRNDICPYCGKVTKSLKSHLLIHTGERKYECEVCSKRFFSESNLKIHKKRHSDTKDFKCDQCIATFICQSSLNSHMRRHRDEKNYVCNMCSKAFKRRQTLVRHVMIHNFASKNIKCNMCNMSFYTKYNLRHHLRVHTGERPFNCEICSQPYSYKHDFNRHCLKKHGIFLKRRSVYVMNEEVLMQERTLMRDLLLRTQGIIKDDKPLYPFDGPQGALAFEQAVKALETRQIPIDLHYAS